jgi:L-threonylcarbamoyladenylate synthase
MRVRGLSALGKKACYSRDYRVHTLTVKTRAVKIDPANIDVASIREAADLIDGGALVAFPTETVYGIACRAKSDSLARLERLKGRPVQKRFTLHIAQPGDVDKYVPRVPLITRKLLRNAWPGPLTVVFELDESAIDQQRKRFERDVFENLYRGGSMGLRCPDHPVATRLLQQTLLPVVAPSANLGGERPALNGDQVLDSLSGRLEMLLDAGPSRYGVNSTVVKIGEKGLEILRQGAYSEETLRSLSRVTFLFVCTGNTCRSPMAEGMFKKYLAEKLRVNLDELDKIGYTVDSAGVIGSTGRPASSQAVVACAARGVDLLGHRNKGLSKELIEGSDYIFVMEPMHREAIVAMVPQVADRCFLLDDNLRIPDPIGHPQSFYDLCAEQIERAVKKRISELAI